MTLDQQRTDFEAAYKRQYPDASPWVWRHFVHSDRGYKHEVTDGMFKLYLAGRLERMAANKPIDMVLHCPACGLQHIDHDETREGRIGIDDQPNSNSPLPNWTNPPHRSHLCHGCGYIWRPADVPTNGVQAITTRGKNDSR